MKKLTALKIAFVTVLGFTIITGCEVTKPPDVTVNPVPNTTIIHDRTPAPAPNVTINPPAASSHTETHTNTTTAPPADTGTSGTTGTSTTTTG